MGNDKNDMLLQYQNGIDKSYICSKTDLHGIITYANDMFCEISGYSKDELIGKNHNIVRHQDMSCDVFAELWACIQNKQVWQGKIKNKKKCGSEYVVHTTVIPILDEENNIVEYTSIRFDITELEKLKREEILHIKTNSVYKLAGGVAHEINTPLTYIKGNIEFIEMYLPDIKEIEIKSSIQDSLNTIKDGISRIGNIVSAVRELSYTGICEIENINIYEPILNACRLVYNRSKRIANIYINNRKFDLNIDNYEFGYSNIMINKHKIKQVFISLINNTLDEFLKLGKEVKDNNIFIDVIEFDNIINIKIKDNANGIPNDMLDILFEPFCSKKEFSGLGIGLNIVKSIIDEHNGSIKVYNQNGAVFEIQLQKT